LPQDIFYESVKKLVKKSLKRRERRFTVRKQKRKRSKTSNETQIQHENSKAYSRCSLPYLFMIIKKVLSCPRYIDLVKNMGFEFMLDLDDCYVPRDFV